MLTSRGPRPLRARALAALFAVAVAAANRAGLGPLRADVSPPALRRASLSAIGEVLRRLGIDAPHVVFGHTHRTGPLAGDDPDEWGRLVNAGSWVLQSHLAAIDGPNRSPSPYRAGGAVEVGEAGPPLLRLLLDDLPPAALRAQAPA
jgi:hypothetical protein